MTDEFLSTAKPAFVAEECLNIQDIVRIRRYFDISCAVIGCILSTIHLSVLIYLQYVRNRKSFEYLLAISALSVIALVTYAVGCVFDLCILPQTASFFFFRGHIWLFSLNAMLCAYGYLVVVLCLDRFVALHKPMFYKETFAKLKVRLLLMLACLLIGCLCCIKWLFFNQITSHENMDTGTTTTSSDVADNGGISEHDTETWWFTILKTVSCIVQYFLSGILMIYLSIKNAHKLRELNKTHRYDGNLRMVGQSSELWQQSHKTVAKICIILAASYCLLNWPYGCFDWFYSDARNGEIGYGIAQIVINLCQAIYLQLNLFLFAYSSRLYRSTLVHVLKSPYRRITQCVRLINSNSSNTSIVTDLPSVTATSVSSKVLWFS